MQKAMQKQSRVATDLLVGGGSVTLVLGATFSLLGFLVPGIVRSYDLGYSAAGLLLSVRGAGSLLFTLAIGMLSEFVGKQCLVIAGTLLLGLTLGLSGLRTPFFILLGIHFVVGIAMGTINGSVYGLFAESYPSSRIWVMGYLQTLFGAGALLGPLYGGFYLVRGFSWSLPLVILVGPALLAALLIKIFPCPQSISAGNREEQDAQQTFSTGIAPVLKSSRTWISGIGMGLYLGAEIMIMVWFPEFFYIDRDLPQNYTAMIVSMYWTGIILGRIGGIAVKPSMALNRLLALAFGLGGILAAVIVLFTPSVSLTLILIVLLGAVLGSVFPWIVTYGCNKFFHATGAVTGVILTTGQVGAMGVSIFSAGLVDTLGFEFSIFLPVVLFWVAAGLYLLEPAVTRLQRRDMASDRR